MHSFYRGKKVISLFIRILVLHRNYPVLPKLSCSSWNSSYYIIISLKTKFWLIFLFLCRTWQKQRAHDGDLGGAQIEFHVPVIEGADGHVETVEGGLPTTKSLQVDQWKRLSETHLWPWLHQHPCLQVRINLLDFVLLQFRNLINWQLSRTVTVCKWMRSPAMLKKCLKSE